MKIPATRIGLVLLLVLGAGLVYHYAWRGPEIVRLPVVEDCALQLQACTAELPQGGTMTFEINPKGASATTALQLSASFRDAQPAAVGARFKGVNMNMGQLEYLVYRLAPVEGGDESAGFSGQAGVFACSVGRMQWLVLVEVQIGETAYEIPYRFETSNSPV